MRGETPLDAKNSQPNSRLGLLTEQKEASPDGPASSYYTQPERK